MENPGVTGAELRDAHQWGRESFRAGAPRVCVADARMLALLESEPCGIGSDANRRHQRLMKAWNDGWDKAHVDAIVEAVMAL